MRELHRNYTLLIVAVCVFLFCVLGLVSFARSSGSSGRFVYSSHSSSTHAALLNNDGTSKSLVVPSGLAHVVSEIVFHSSSVGMGTDDPFFTFYSVEQVDALMYLSNLLQSVGGAAKLFYALDNRSTYTQPPNLLPVLQDQSCVGSCYAHAAGYALQAARKMYSAALHGGLGEVEPAVLIRIQETLAPSRAWIAYYYKRIFKNILADSPLSQGGHPIAALLAVRVLGSPLESQYSYPSEYYRGFQKTTRSGITYYACQPPHVSDSVLSDVFQKYAQAPAGGVAALARIYGYNTFEPKILFHDQSKMLHAVACSFSIERTCATAYGSHTAANWQSMSEAFVKRLRQALMDGLGVAIGIPVFASWARSGYAYQLPFPVDVNDQVTGYHAMAAVNFSLTSEECTGRSDLNVYWNGSAVADAGCVTLRNSWGESAGACRVINVDTLKTNLEKQDIMAIIPCLWLI